MYYFRKDPRIRLQPCLFPLVQKYLLFISVNCNGNTGDSGMGEKCWQNPYNYGDENALVQQQKLANLQRAGEFNRQRWGSLWGQQQDTSRDPTPPSWLERGLSRLDHNPQVRTVLFYSVNS